MSKPAEWHRIASERSMERFGSGETLERMKRNDPDFKVVEMTGWTHIVPELLGSVLRQNRYVISLSLEACILRDAGVKIVCVALRDGGPPLEHLNLSGNGISDDGVVELATAISSHRTLRHLNLSWNEISDIGAQALAHALISTSALKVLELDGLTEGPGGGHRFGMLQTDHLIGKNCNVGDAGCMALAQAIPQSQLKRLSMSRQTRITAVSLVALSSALSTSNLEELELRRIPIDDDGAVALADALPNSQIRSLQLTINKITDRGAMALAQAISRGQTIETMCLTQSNIGLKGLEALEKAASMNLALQRFELYGHAAGKAGSSYVWKIKPWLKQNRSTRAILMKSDVSLYPHLIFQAARLPNATRLYLILRQIPTIFDMDS